MQMVMFNVMQSRTESKVMIEFSLTQTFVRTEHRMSTAPTLITVTPTTSDPDAADLRSLRASTFIQSHQKAPQLTTHQEVPLTHPTPPMTHIPTQTLEVTPLTLLMKIFTFRQETTAPTFGSNQQMAPMFGDGLRFTSQPAALMPATRRSRLASSSLKVQESTDSTFMSLVTPAGNAKLLVAITFLMAKELANSKTTTNFLPPGEEQPTTTVGTHSSNLTEKTASSDVPLLSTLLTEHASDAELLNLVAHHAPTDCAPHLNRPQRRNQRSQDQASTELTYRQ